jgi:hypothetical protein
MLNTQVAKLSAVLMLCSASTTFDLSPALANTFEDSQSLLAHNLIESNSENDLLAFDFIQVESNGAETAWIQVEIYDVNALSLSFSSLGELSELWGIRIMLYEESYEEVDGVTYRQGYFYPGSPLTQEEFNHYLSEAKSTISLLFERELSDNQFRELYSLSVQQNTSYYSTSAASGSYSASQACLLPIENSAPKGVFVQCLQDSLWNFREFIN